MHTNLLWDDVVVFQLVSAGLAAQLAQRLRSSWPAWCEPLDTGWAVGVELHAEPDDLPRLLRDVSTWLGECRLHSLAFELDGRVYNLRPVGREFIAAAT